MMTIFEFVLLIAVAVTLYIAYNWARCAGYTRWFGRDVEQESQDTDEGDQSPSDLVFEDYQDDDPDGAWTYAEIDIHVHLKKSRIKVPIIHFFFVNLI